jgi:glucuronate isomerase
MNYKKRSVCEFIITKIDHIVEHIIPFFDKHLHLSPTRFVEDRRFASLHRVKIPRYVVHYERIAVQAYLVLGVCIREVLVSRMRHL